MTSCGCVVCLDSPGQKKTVKNKLKILSRWFFLQRHLPCPLKTRNYTQSWNKRLFHFCQKKFFRGGVSGSVNVSWWCRLGVTAGKSFLSSRDVWLFSSNKRKYKTFGILSVHDTNYARPSRKEKCRPAQFHPNSCDIFYLLSFLYPVTTFKYGERNTAKKKNKLHCKDSEVSFLKRCPWYWAAIHRPHYWQFSLHLLSVYHAASRWFSAAGNSRWKEMRVSNLEANEINNFQC